MEYIRATRTPEQAGAYYVRIQAMARKHHIPLEREFDAHDTQDTKYIVCLDQDFPIGTARMYPLSVSEVMIGRVVVLPEYRHQGIGTQIVLACEAWAQDLGFQTAVLEARDNKIAFYEQLGYKTCGEPFVEGDTFRCIRMEKPLPKKISTEVPEKNIQVRSYTDHDIPEMVRIWNEVVEDGIAFPQEDLLTLQTGTDFFQAQSYCGVAEDMNHQLVGLYILHPNNIGRCGHICNASYAVSRASRGQHVGRALVMDCLKTGKELGFRILQFNAVVASNQSARHLYESLGFTQLGVIPQGFRMKDGHYEDICPYYHLL